MSVIVKSKLGEGTGQESGPLYASWQSARAQSGLLRRPLSISLGGGGQDPPDPPGYGPELYIVDCTLCIIHCIIYDVQCTIYIIQYTIYIIQYTLYTVLFTYTSRFKSIYNCPTYPVIMTYL